MQYTSGRQNYAVFTEVLLPEVEDVDLLATLSAASQGNFTMLNDLATGMPGGPMAFVSMVLRAIISRTAAWAMRLSISSLRSCSRQRARSPSLTPRRAGSSRPIRRSQASRRARPIRSSSQSILRRRIRIIFDAAPQSSTRRFLLSSAASSRAAAPIRATKASISSSTIPPHRRPPSTSRKS